MGGTLLYIGSVSVALLLSSCELFVRGWLERILLAQDKSGATTCIAGIETFGVLNTLEVEEGMVGEVMVVVMCVEGGWSFSLPSLIEFCPLLGRVSAAEDSEQDVTGKLFGLEPLFTPLASVVPQQLSV